ncbi:cold shock domain-containing protein CG9705 [Folsomia candida]|uniref:cold shock domain-containing protein CG9705 n=1 Tax=Folsomia candida TaxID=158441 RepID=UPI000B8F5033|nr:cold shock domain-containing protein CG9705 [Folsomia candida]
MDAELNRKTLELRETGSQPNLEANPVYPVLNLGEPAALSTEPLSIHRGGKQASPCASPTHPNSPGGLHIPHIFHGGNVITKRNRSNSTYERAKDNPIEHGIIKYFNRSKGHGFIVKDQREGEEIFVHISDIEGELVPRTGDQVTYRLCPIPPKLDKFQAIHVRIVNFTEEVHLRWDSPLREEEKSDLLPDPYVT